MYYSYVEIEYVATNFSPARMDLALKLLKPNTRWNYGINSCDKGLTQEMVTTTTAVTSTMQIVEYHVKYNTTTDQTHLKQTTVVVGVRVNLKKGYHRSNK